MKDDEHRVPQQPEGWLCRPTVLFADIEGYTRLTEQFRDDYPAALMGDRLRRASFEIVARHGCEQRQFRGDEIIACFGVRSEVEDAPLRACKAALEIQRWMSREAEWFARSHGVRPRLRLSVNTGHALYWESTSEEGRSELFVHGEALNMGKRIETEAEPGTVYIGPDTYRLVKHRVEAQPVGDFELKGFDGPRTLYRLHAVHHDVTPFGAALRSGVSPLLERDHALARLRALIGDTTAAPLAIAHVTGDPGIGKSRLVWEFAQLARAHGLDVFWGNCRMDGRAAPYHPFVDLLGHADGFGIRDSDDDAAARRKLERVVGATLGLDPALHVPYLLNLLGRDIAHYGIGEDAEVLGLRTRDALIRILCQRAKLHPFVLILEDLHWIDALSEALVRRLVDSSHDVPITAVCTYRAGDYTPPWDGHEQVRRIELAPLSEHATHELIVARLAAGAAPADLSAYVVAHSEGNPLIAEEIVNDLLETGRLVAADGAIRFQAPPAEEATPERPRQIFASRLGRVDGQTRRVIEAACVLGRRFDGALAGRVSQVDDPRASLRTLTEQGLVSPDPSAPGVYAFKHALIQEVAYQGLIRSRREELHAHAGDVIERLYAERVAEAADRLAHHFVRAYENVGAGGGEDRDGAAAANPHAAKAFRYLKLAGERSLRVYSVDAAEQQLSRALEIHGHQPRAADRESLVTLVLSLARICYYRADIAAQVALLERYLDDARRHRAMLPAYLGELGYGYVYACRSDDAARILSEAQRLATDACDERALGRVTVGLLWHHVFFVSPDAAQRERVLELGRQAERLGESTRDPWLQIAAKFALAQDAVMHANPRRIRDCADALLALHRTHDDNRAKSLAAVVLTEMHALNMNHEQAARSAAVAREHAVTDIDRYNVDCAEGVAAAMAGRGRDALALLDPTRRALVERGVHLARLLIDLPLGVARIAAGELSAGTRHIRRESKALQALGYTMGSCNGHSFLGEVYTRIALRDGALSTAQLRRNLFFIALAAPRAARIARRHLQHAIACNTRYDAPSYVAWAELNLGRLDRKRGERDAARAHLQRALALADGVDAHALGAAALLELAALEQHCEQRANAREHLLGALQRAQQVGATEVLARALLALADAAAGEQRIDEAVAHLGEAREALLRVGRAGSAPMIEQVDRRLAALRAHRAAS